MHEAIKDVFGSMFEAILNGEMENYLGYGSNSKSEKSTENRRNGYSDKKLKTSMGKRPKFQFRVIVLPNLNRC